MKNLIRLSMLAALATFASVSAFAQDTAAAANPCEEAARTELYTKYYEMKKGDAAAQKQAYGIAQEYLQKYASCNDQYSKAVQKFAGQYDAAVRVTEFPKYLYGTDAQNTGRDFAKAFTLGKEILAATPNDLGVLINLGYAGYTAQSLNPSVTTYSADSLNYAKTAIQMIEAGQNPSSWTPFKGKEDSLGYLNFAVGEYLIKSNPSEALPYYLKAATYAPTKETPLTYGRLAWAYQISQYEPMQKEFTAKYGGKPETEESKHALNNLNQVMDRVMDAYARAISLAGTKPELQQAKAGWMELLTGFYKFRNNDSTTGLDAFIASAVSKPLPQPFTPQPYVPADTPAPATGATSEGNGNGATDATATPAAAAPAATTQPAAATAAKPKPATKKP